MDYCAFLFQAKGEEQAGDLIDIQAMRMYEGWGAKMLFQRTAAMTYFFEPMISSITCTADRVAPVATHAGWFNLRQGNSAFRTSPGVSCGIGGDAGGGRKGTN